MNGEKVKRELKHLLKMRDTAMTEGGLITKEELPDILRMIEDMRNTCTHRDENDNYLITIDGNRLVCNCCNRVLNLK